MKTDTLHETDGSLSGDLPLDSGFSSLGGLKRNSRFLRAMACLVVAALAAACALLITAWYELRHSRDGMNHPSEEAQSRSSSPAPQDQPGAAAPSGQDSSTSSKTAP